MFMDLVNLMYRYINKFINSDKLIEELKKINLHNYSLEEQEQIKKLNKDIQNIKDNVSNEVDDIERKRLASINHLLEAFEQINDEELDLKSKEFLNKRRESLKKEKEVVRDGGLLYQNIFELLTNNGLINKYARKMNDLELLEFITKYISVPMPPVLNQDEFNDLVLVGIKNDMREALWRLAFNYNHKEKDFTLIEDYFLQVKDYYYLTELISAVEEDLDKDRLLKKIIATHDKEFIINVVKDGYQIGIFSKDEVTKIIYMGVEINLITFKEKEKLLKELDKNN